MLPLKRPHRGLQNVLHHTTAVQLHYSFLSVTVIKRELQSVAYMAVTVRNLKQQFWRQPVGNRCTATFIGGSGGTRVRTAAVLMRSKYLWVIWLGIKSGQSSLKGSVRMINLILLLLSGLVMAIRAEKGVRPLIFGFSSFTACRIPSSFIHGCWIDCLFSPMNDKAALGPTGWERRAGGADTAHFHLYARWISPSCLASLEVGFLHYLLDNHQHFNMVNQTVTVI